MTTLSVIKYPGATRTLTTPMWPGSSDMTCEQFMQAHPDPKEAREFLLDGKEDEDGVEVLKRALDAAEEHFFGHHSLMQKQRSLSGDYRGKLSAQSVFVEALCQQGWWHQAWGVGRHDRMLRFATICTEVNARLHALGFAPRTMNSLKQNMHSMTNQLRATCEYIGEMSVLHPPLKMLAMAKWMFPHFQLVLDTIGKRKGYMPSALLVAEETTYDEAFTQWIQEDLHALDLLKNNARSTEQWSKIAEHSGETAAPVAGPSKVAEPLQAERTKRGGSSQVAGSSRMRSSQGQAAKGEGSSKVGAPKGAGSFMVTGTQEELGKPKAGRSLTARESFVVEDEVEEGGDESFIVEDEVEEGGDESYEEEVQAESSDEEGWYEEEVQAESSDEEGSYEEEGESEEGEEGESEEWEERESEEGEGNETRLVNKRKISSSGPSPVKKSRI